MPNDADTLKPDKFRIGRIDNSGEKVVRIYYQSSDYVVYRSKRGIYVDIDDDSKKLEQLHASNLRLCPQLARVYSLLPARLGRTEPINMQIARAVALNLSGATPEAQEMLSDAEARVRRLKLIDGRLQYTVSSLMTAVIAVAIYLLLVWKGEAGASKFTQYAQMSACGALGGFLSVVLGFRRLEIDLDANWLVNCLVGSTRILIAMVGAIFAFFVVKSGLAFQPLDEPNSPYGVYVVGIIAGFSERFVPNIMDNVAHVSAQKVEEPPSAGPDTPEPGEQDKDDAVAPKP